jgi:DNA polymerase-3 subunit epsilon
MSIICGIDLETTGFDCKKELVTEVGAVLWDTEMNRPVKFFNELVKIDRPLTQEIINLTGIDDALLSQFGEDSTQVWNDLKKFCSKADAFMAHNAPFDRGFIEHHGFKTDKLWIDSCVDVPYDKAIQTRKLTYLASDHGFVNPFAHRAVTDTLSMFAIVENYDWNEVIENAKQPNATMCAMVTYQDNKLAKNAGYRWDGEKKFWVKTVKENKINEETIKCKDIGFLSKRIG